MGIKHHGKPDGVIYKNGSRCFRTVDNFAGVSKVENCPCEDGIRRTVHATAEPDTFFSIPACVYLNPPTTRGRAEPGARSKTVGGFLTTDEDGWKFIAYSYGKNAGLIKKA